ncbi:MAG: ribonuclease Z [Promethearchaeia archaeon]
MEIIILGSSGAIPVKNRNLSSFLIKYRSNRLLFDCGEDIQRQFIKAGIKFNKPLEIFISHFHGDHIIGLPGLLFRFALIARTAPIRIFGRRNLFSYLVCHKKILGLRAPYPLKVVEIDPENDQLIIFEGLETEEPKEIRSIQDNIILDKKRYVVKYALMNHSVPTFGFSFIEQSRYGKFYPEKARELGIPEGPLWGIMQEGKPITFKGKEIDPEEEGIVGPKRPGRKITYSADTAPCQPLIDLGKDSDLLVHEATYGKEHAEVAHEKLHSTSSDAARDAKKMNAKKLLLTHISSRYQKNADHLLQEAREIFSSTYLAKDLMKIKIK